MGLELVLAFDSLPENLLLAHADVNHCGMMNEFEGMIVSCNSARRLSTASTGFALSYERPSWTGQAQVIGNLRRSWWLRKVTGRKECKESTCICAGAFRLDYSISL